MLEKIVHRDERLAKYKTAPAWSYRWEGAIDKDTANKIDEEMGGLIKSQWEHTTVSGDVLANLIFEKYKHLPNLKAEWDKLTGRDK
jgi:hypothetical protein